MTILKMTLLDVIRARAAQEADGLVFVPDLPGPAKELMPELLALAHLGRIELRPHSGYRLSAIAESRCPRGINGIVLSYARVIE